MSGAVRVLRMALCVACALSAACSDATRPPLPVPGSLLGTWSTPAADDGAVLLVVRGPGVTAVSAARAELRLFWRDVSDTEVRVIAAGRLTPGPLLRIDVPDVRSAQAYSVEIIEVAATDDALREQGSRTLTLAPATAAAPLAAAGAPR